MTGEARRLEQRLDEVESAVVVLQRAMSAIHEAIAQAQADTLVRSAVVNDDRS